MHWSYKQSLKKMGTAGINKDSVLGASLVLSVVSLVLLFGLTWYFQTSLDDLDLLQHQVEHDRELLLMLQDQMKVRNKIGIATCTYS